MPFQYYGGKKGLARYYPPPAFGTIIEPFAGSAGYALHWATPQHRVILIEKDPDVAKLWRRLQSMTAGELASIECPPSGERCSDPLIGVCAGGVGGVQTLRTATDPSRDFKVTDRMWRDWPEERRRLLGKLEMIRGWTFVEGDYTDGALRPARTATWFIDPPYWVPRDGHGTRGDGYRHGAAGIDYEALAAWCRTRRGQVIVCEQEGADWLPFRPLRRWNTANGDAGSRTEMVWTRTPGSVLATPRARQAKVDASARRQARRR